MWTGKKKLLKAPAYENSSICFYSSMSHASAGLVYGYLKARLHGITSINITIFSHWSENLESHTISHKIQAATSFATIPTSSPKMLVSITLQKPMWHIIKTAKAVDLITLKTQFLTQRHDIPIKKTYLLKTFRETVPEYSMNHVKPNKRDWTKCRF